MQIDNHFFILGAAKCGTTSLHYYLSQHPNICMSTPKEPPFFELHYEKGLEHYRKTCFEARTNEKWTGEARHRNLYLPYTAERIAASFPKAPFIAILREPTSRAFSHYLHRRRHGFETLSFADAIADDFERIERGEFINTTSQIEKYGEKFKQDTSYYHRTYIDTGYYAEQIERFTKYFDPSQILVVFLEDLLKDPQQVVRKALAHIDQDLIHHTFNVEPQNVKTGETYQKLHRFASRMPFYNLFRDNLTIQSIKQKAKEGLDQIDKESKPEVYSIDEKTKRFLKDHFRSHNRKLEEIANRDLSHWDEL